MVARKVFTSQKLKILVDGKEFQIQALVSALGAKFVFEEQDIPTELSSNLGKDLNIVYRDNHVKGRLVREKTVTGLMYNLKFNAPSKSFMSMVEADILDSGLPSPWRRALPRLSTAVKNLPAPSLVVLYHNGSTLFLTVRNFTLGGMLCEYLGKDLSTLNVGVKLNFDIVTNSGDKISELSGIVCHISEESLDESGGSVLCHYGIRLLSMNLLSETKYKFLIREYCMGVETKD